MIRPLFTLLFAVLALAACRADRARNAEPPPDAAPARTDDSAAAAEAPPPAAAAGDPGETRGASASAPVETTGPDLAAIRYRALGTEPFWGVEVTTDRLVLERPGEDPRVFGVDEVRRRPGTDVVVASDGSAQLTVEVRRERCSDGMSDREYAFSSTMELGGETFRGCAFEEEILVREAEVDPVAEAGLAAAVDAAREIRDGQDGYERVVGGLDRPDGEAAFAGHFEDGEVRMIEYRLRKGDEVLEETSFYFFRAPGPGGTSLLADGEAWAEGSRDYTWYLFGYGPDGAGTGSRVEHGDGEGAEIPDGMTAEKRDLAMRLKEAAERRHGG